MMLLFPIPLGKQKVLFSSFSVYTNGIKLFRASSSASKDSYIECLHGIRALSTLWIVHGHRVQMYNSFPTINRVQFREVINADVESFSKPFKSLLGKSQKNLITEMVHKLVIAVFHIFSHGCRDFLLSERTVVDQKHFKGA